MSDDHKDLEIKRLHSAVDTLQAECARYRRIVEEIQLTIALEAREYDGLRPVASIANMAKDLQKAREALKDFSGFLKSIKAHALSGGALKAVSIIDGILKQVSK